MLAWFGLSFWLFAFADGSPVPSPNNEDPANFTSVVDALVTGERVTYYINIQECESALPSGPDSVYGDVDVYQYFFDEELFGPVEYVSVSTTVYTLNDEAGENMFLPKMVSTLTSTREFVIATF